MCIIFLKIGRKDFMINMNVIAQKTKEHPDVMSVLETVHRRHQ